MGGDYKLVEVYPSILVPVASFCSFFQSVFYILQNPFCECPMALINIISFFVVGFASSFERERVGRRLLIIERRFRASDWSCKDFTIIYLQNVIFLQRLHDHLSTKHQRTCRMQWISGRRWCDRCREGEWTTTYQEPGRHNYHNNYRNVLYYNKSITVNYGNGI